MYIGSEGVTSPPDIPFAIQLTSDSAVLSQPVTVTVTSGDGSALGMRIPSTLTPMPINLSLVQQILIMSQLGYRSHFLPEVGL